MSGKFYVYEHWRPDTSTCFYVGMGKKRRANAMSYRNWLHVAVQKQLGILGLVVEVRIVKDGMTREEAFTLEIERIAFWRNNGVDLCNLTSGGEGSKEVADSTRELLRVAHLGRKLTDETKAKISEGSKRALSAPEVREKISAALKEAATRPEFREHLIRVSRSQVRTAEHNAKIAAAHKGKKLSPEHAAKARNASVGRKQTPEEIERRRAANTGKKRSPEFCQRMRELQQRLTPEQNIARSARLAAINANQTMEQIAALIARNKARAGQKRGPYKRVTAAIAAARTAEKVD